MYLVPPPQQYTSISFMLSQLTLFLVKIGHCILKMSIQNMELNFYKKKWVNLILRLSYTRH